MLDVAGDATARSASSPTAAQRRGPKASSTRAASSGAGEPAASSHARAIRHGSRIASSPRAWAPATGARPARRPRGRRRAALRPRSCRRARSLCRRRSRRRRQRAHRARPGSPRGGRGGAARPARARRRAPARRRSTGTRVQVVHDDLRLDGEQRWKWSIPAEGPQGLPVGQVADVVGHPRARARGQAERALELRAAGQQRPRRPTGRSIPPGTCPRERRSSIPRPRTTRATESSVRMWIGRSCRRKRSAIAPRRASASASS